MSTELKGPGFHFDVHTDLRADQKAEVLIEALPWLEEFAGQRIVVKYGGNAMINEDLRKSVMGDIVLSTAAQQYGGFTVPEVDKILAPYAQKSYDYYVKEFLKYTDASWEGAQEKAIEYAIDKVRRECDQGWQGIEHCRLFPR